MRLKQLLIGLYGICCVLLFCIIKEYVYCKTLLPNAAIFILLVLISPTFFALSILQDLTHSYKRLIIANSIFVLFLFPCIQYVKFDGDLFACSLWVFYGALFCVDKKSSEHIVEICIDLNKEKLKFSKITEQVLLNIAKNIGAYAEINKQDNSVKIIFKHILSGCFYSITAKIKNEILYIKGYSDDVKRFSSKIIDKMRAKTLVDLAQPIKEEYNHHHTDL